MKKFKFGILLLSLLSVSASFADAIRIDNLTVKQVTSSRKKASITLAQGQGGQTIKLDCLDGRRPSNTLLTIIPGISFNSGPKHSVFTGISDFYCTGIMVELTKGLKVGDMLSLELDLDFKPLADDVDYEIAKGKDLRFIISNEVRSLKNNPGSMIKLESTEPVAQ